jgi:hypothetical protein
LSAAVPPIALRRVTNRFTAFSALLVFHGTPSWSRNVKSFGRHRVSRLRNWDRLDHRLHERRERGGQPLQVVVERVLDQLVVKIPGEMNQALLLRAV